MINKNFQLHFSTAILSLYNALEDHQNGRSKVTIAEERETSTRGKTETLSQNKIFLPSLPTQHKRKSKSKNNI